MADDAEYTVLTLPRADGGECRIVRVRRDGEARTRLWRYHMRDGELRAGQVLSILDHEIGAVINALQRIERKVASTQGDESPPTHRRQSQHRTRDAAQPTLGDGMDPETERLF